MSLRHFALVVAAVAVLGLGVYLFVAVHSSPAQAQVAPITPPPAAREATAIPAAAPVQIHAPAPAVPVASHDAPAPALEEPTNDQPAPVDIPHLGAMTKLDMIMDQANKAYDGQDYEDARAIAGKVLAKQPNNVRMLRIMVSSSCIEGDPVVAQKYYEQLPKADRDQMKVRCDRYGVTFHDP